MRSKINKLLLDPTRLGILEHLMAQPSTTLQLQHRFPDISRATLYRVIAELKEAGLIAVVNSRTVRGVQERTWALSIQAQDLHPLKPPPERRMEAVASVFTAFVAIPTARLDAQDVEDWLRASSTRIHVTPGDMASLTELFGALIRPYLQPREGTRPVHLTTFLVPTAPTDTDTDTDTDIDIDADGDR
ncbi:MAG: helix-turn-helix domain-containing protein [Myxococcota bacterium]